MKLLHSLSFRLVLAYVALFIVSFLIVIAVNYWFVIVRPMDRAQTLVRAEHTDLVQVYERQGRAALLAELEVRDHEDDQRKAFHAFIAADGDVETANLPSWPDKPAEDWSYIEADYYAGGDEVDYEALVLDTQFADGTRLIVGRDVEDIRDREEVLASSVLWTLGIVLLLGAGGGAVMSRVIGQRVEAVSRTARLVIAGDPSGRVPLRGSGDDFDRLAETLNLMLDRLQASAEAVRRVSDHVAHELRTPLARLHTMFERFLEVRDTDSAAAEHLEAIQSEIAQLQRVFDAVLRIARLESGRHAADFAPVDMAALLADAADLYAPEAEARGLDLVLDARADAVVQGDRDLLFQAVCNILDNAVKFTPAGAVRIGMTVTDGAVRIDVSDTGPRVPPGWHGRLTERFFRVPDAEPAPGFGLGLSLVAGIADLHGARLSFADCAPGLCVSWRQPVIAAHAPKFTQ